MLDEMIKTMATAMLTELGKGIYFHLNSLPLCLMSALTELSVCIRWVDAEMKPH